MAAPLSFAFSHAFARGVPPADYLRFGERGFTVHPERVVPHDGGQFSRFLLFDDGKYLEFIDIPDRAVFEAMLASRRRLPHSTALSFKIEGAAEPFFQEMRAAFPDRGAIFEHKNHSRQKGGSPERLPGWNFIRFEKPLLEGAEIWCTEVEPRPGPKPGPSPASHPNGATRVLGAVLATNPSEGLSALERLTGRGAPQGILTLDDGTRLWGAAQHPALAEAFAGNTAAVKAVVVEAKDLSFFAERSGAKERIEFSGGEAAVLRGPAGAFDFLVVGAPAS